MRRWWRCLDGAKLLALLFLWISSWLFLLPVQSEVNTPYFDNLWGAFLMLFGASKKQTLVVYQKPDLVCSSFSYLFILILWYRGTISSFCRTRKKALYLACSIVSIVIHSFFLSIFIKVVLFPQTGADPVSYIEILKSDIGLLLLAATIFCMMAFGPKSTSALAFALLFFVAILKNIRTVSRLMGDAGFVAITFCVIAFYLEFYAIGFNRILFASDLNYIFNFNLEPERNLICRNGKYFVPLEEADLYSQGSKNLHDVYKIQRKLDNFFMVKNKKVAVVLISICLFFVISMPVYVIRQVVLLKGGWNGITWNSTESQVKDWIKTNNSGYSYRKCPFSHFGVKCNLLEWKTESGSPWSSIEFQFADSRFCCVVENGPILAFENIDMENFDVTDYGVDKEAKFLEEILIESKQIKKSGQKIDVSNKVQIYEQKGFFNASTVRFCLLLKVQYDGENQRVLNCRLVKQTFKRGGNTPSLPPFEEYEFE
ncbi:MAG: hypothetical protein UHP28_09290 [Treponema sp.]|nr:hypothetical protein [Treponema sp.]